MLDQLALLAGPLRLSRIGQNLDLALAGTGLGDVVGRLHPQERVHADAEGLLQTQGHFGREGSPRIEQRRRARREETGQKSALIQSRLILRPEGFVW